MEPVNLLPNPYVTIRDFGTLPDGRSWGSVSAVNVDIDGIHIWAGDRCGTNSCAGSDVDPIVKLDPDGNVVQSLGAGLLIWPHGMDVDAEGNVWVVDARVANARELQNSPNAAGKGSAVIKFSPEGEVLLVLGTPGTIGDPPTHFTDPNDVLVAPDGSIFVAETHGAQFQSSPGPDSKSRISKFAPDGTFIMSSRPVGLRGRGVPVSAFPRHGFAGAAICGRPGQSPDPDLRSARNSPRHLVSVQPNQRALH